MYCSLSEVWGDVEQRNIYRENNNNNHNNNNNYNKINNDIKNDKIIEHFNNDKKINCDIFLHHIVDCLECQKKITDKLCKKNDISFNSLIPLNNIDKETKETIIIFLYGIVFIIILKILFD